MSKIIRTNGIAHDADDHGARIAATHGIARSSLWRKAEHDALNRNPHCIVSGTTDKVQVHHGFIPFHFAILLGYPWLEVDQWNLFTFAMSKGNEKHLLVGHADDFVTWNPNFLVDAKRWKGQSDDAIRADPLFSQRMKTRPATWAKMAEKDRHAWGAFLAKNAPKKPADWDLRTKGKR